MSTWRCPTTSTPSESRERESGSGPAAVVILIDGATCELERSHVEIARGNAAAEDGHIIVGFCLQAAFAHPNFRAAIAWRKDVGLGERNDA